MPDDDATQKQAKTAWNKTLLVKEFNSVFAVLLRTVFIVISL